MDSKILGVYPSSSGNEITVCTQRESYCITRRDFEDMGFSAEFDENEGAPLSEETLEQLDFLAKKLSCVKYAQYLLGFGDKSERALLLKLSSKGYEKEVCAGALDILKRNGVVDDTRLCAHKAALLFSEKHFGPYRLKKELCARGFDSKTVQDTLDSQNFDYSEGINLLFSKLARGKDLQDEKVKKKLFSKLNYYGYSYSDVSELFSEYAEDEDF